MKRLWLRPAALLLLASCATLQRSRDQSQAFSIAGLINCGRVEELVELSSVPFLLDQVMELATMKKRPFFLTTGAILILFVTIFTATAQISQLKRRVPRLTQELSALVSSIHFDFEVTRDVLRRALGQRDGHGSLPAKGPGISRPRAGRPLPGAGAGRPAAAAPAPPASPNAGRIRRRRTVVPG